MANSKNFSPQILQKSTSSRSLADPVPEPEPERETDTTVPTPQEMIDSLYYILTQRLDHIEHLIEETDCQCQKK
jgi:hypothetical protein